MWCATKRCLNPCFNGRCTRTVLQLVGWGRNGALGLNPCFNGRCTRTLPVASLLSFGALSLNPCFNGRCTRTLGNCISGISFLVLILVLMEDALVLRRKDLILSTFVSLNPCFNGRCTRTPNLAIC